MKKLTTLSILFLLIVVSACKKEKSLQSYLVDSQGKNGFIAGDIPVSSLLSNTENLTEDVKETIKTIKKVNFVALPIKDNEAAYEVEKEKLKNIFTNKDYKNLVQMKVKGMNVKLYYTGNSDAIDEVIAFGYSKKNGVGVARLLGKNMNPAKIIEMLQTVKMDASNIKLDQFSALFKGK